MKKRQNAAVLILALFFLTVAALLSPLYLSDGLFNSDPKVEIHANQQYDKTLRVVGDIDYQPYSFLDANGVYSGHDVELVSELANRLQRNLDLQLMSWQQALDAVRTGKADLVMGAEMIYATEFRDGISMSVPIVSDPFVAFGKKTVSNIRTLYNKNLAVIQSSGAQYILHAYQLDSFCHPYENYTDAFASVASGENDYVIVRYSVGRLIQEKLSLKDIKASKLVLMDNNLCFGIAQDNLLLKEQVDAEIVAMIADGTLDKLQSKWLDSYVRVQSFQDFLAQNIWIVAVYISAVVLLLFIYLIANARLSRAKEALLTKLAETDSLTGIFNRKSVEKQIRQILNDKICQRMHALFIIDIDNFKEVNDQLGHMRGDIILRTLAENLQDSFRENDVIGRLGGDEFFVFMRNIPNQNILTEKAQQVCTLFRSTYSRNDLTCPISASIGIAVYPDHGKDFDTLYEHADTALYLSKENGKDTYTLYDGTIGAGYHAKRTGMDR